jgi:hypothetical protein
MYDLWIVNGRKAVIVLQVSQSPFVTALINLGGPKSLLMVWELPGRDDNNVILDEQNKRA